MHLLKTKLENIFVKAINSAGLSLPEGIEIIRTSDRPDLSDFQSNIAMNLAKLAKSNPRAIAEQIVAGINEEGLSLSIDGPGFINLTLSPDFVANTLKDETFETKADNPQKIIVDYGGPNVAKPLHVGHLRSNIIGETIKNIAKFKGHNVIGDIHLGDWGLPMGMIIAAIKEQGLTLPLTAEVLNPIYSDASKRAKEDEEFMKIVQAETKKLQDGDEDNRRIWQSFLKTSKDDIKSLLDKLKIEFDLWLGESDANDDVGMLIQKFRKGGFTKLSQGAEIIDLKDYPQNNSEVPPFIAVKSNGAVMYSMTDMGTLYDRVERQKADEIWYVADSRQSLHFHQVFSAAEITGVKGNTTLKHFPFGNVLGEGGTPLKTRDGGNVSLDYLITETISKVKTRLLENEEFAKFSKEEVEKTATDIGITALKFADLINPRTTDYIFNIEKFTSFEGKTGPYILYTAVRIKSLIKMIGLDFTHAKIILTGKEDKALALKLLGFTESIDRALITGEPHIFVGYIYDLAVAFNNFYHSCNIGKCDDMDIKLSWLKLSNLTLQAFETFAKIIKINIPERM